MSENLEWFDPTPLDVRQLAVCILKEIDMALRYDLREVENELGHPLSIPYRGKMSGLAETINNLVLQFDGCRTEQLRFLKTELVRLHSVTIQPVFVTSVPANEGIAKEEKPS